MYLKSEKACDVQVRVTVWKLMKHLKATTHNAGGSDAGHAAR